MRIWSREAYHQLKADGVCVRCGKRYSTPGETMCAACAERRAEQHRRDSHRAIEAGFCPRHRTSQIMPGYRCCILCIAKDRHRKQQAKRESA